MTNERAIEILNLDLDILGQYGCETAEAYKMAIQALEAQPCEDCISRQKALACFEQTNTRQGAKYAIETLPSVTPRRDLAETSQDCISREEVQDLISRWLSDYLLDETREALETINYKVGDMPPVKPKRPKGKWIWDLRMGLHKCSVCSKFCDFDYLYCPNCGSYNGGEKE